MGAWFCTGFFFLVAVGMIWVAIEYSKENLRKSKNQNFQNISNDTILRDLVVIDTMIRGEEFIHSNDPLDEMVAFSLFDEFSSEQPTDDYPDNYYEDDYVEYNPEDDVQDYDDYYFPG